MGAWTHFSRAVWRMGPKPKMAAVCNKSRKEEEEADRKEKGKLERRRKVDGREGQEGGIGQRGNKNKKG